MAHHKRNRQLKMVFSIAALAILLTGCASKPSDAAKFEAASIEKQMILSAKVVAESKQIRARSENALRLASLSDAEKEKYSELVKYIPPGLDMPLSFNERIEAARVLQLIAQMTRWDFDSRGRLPVNGAMVHVNRELAPAFDIIIDIESQVKDRAKVILVEYQEGSPKKGMIILEYIETNL